MRVVLGLRDQVGGDPVGTSRVRDDGNLARAGEEVDRAVSATRAFAAAT